MNTEQIRRAIDAASDDELRHDWPYGFDLTHEGTVALNRHYKPCGTRTKAWIVYEPYRRHWPALDLDALRRAASEWRPAPDGSVRCWLFDDGCPPWRGARHRRAYVERVIAVLEALGACRSETQPRHDA